METTLTPVTRSSTIEGVGHDPSTLTLTVRFKGGARYRYQNITPDMFAKLLAAPSMGGHLAKYIKSAPAAFPCTKLDGPAPSSTLEDRVVLLETRLLALADDFAFHMTHGHRGEIRA